MTVDKATRIRWQQTSPPSEQRECPHFGFKDRESCRACLLIDKHQAEQALVEQKRYTQNAWDQADAYIKQIGEAEARAEAAEEMNARLNAREEAQRHEARRERDRAEAAELVLENCSASRAADAAYAEARIKELEGALEAAHGELMAFQRGESGLPFKSPGEVIRPALEIIDAALNQHGLSEGATHKSSRTGAGDSPLAESEEIEKGKCPCGCGIPLDEIETHGSGWGGDRG